MSVRGLTAPCLAYNTNSRVADHSVDFPSVISTISDEARKSSGWWCGFWGFLALRQLCGIAVVPSGGCPFAVVAPARNTTTHDESKVKKQHHKHQNHGV